MFLIILKQKKLYGSFKIKETTKMFDSWEKNSKLWLKKG